MLLELNVSKEICCQFIRKSFVTSLSERDLLPVYQKEICYQLIRKSFDSRAIRDNGRRYIYVGSYMSCHLISIVMKWVW